MPKQSKSISSVTTFQATCYVKWLRLKVSKGYREASEEIRLLQQRLRDAEERYQVAHDAYLPHLQPSAPDSRQKHVAQQEYWTAQEATNKLQCELTSIEDQTCKKFGLFQWGNPDDTSITIENAHYLFSSSPPVIVLNPSPDNRMSRNTKVDKEGWLTLKVNLNAPLERTEQAIGRLLRFYRNPPKTRHRPDKVAEALETWACYEQTKRFSEVSHQLKRPVSTVKGQYLRAFVLIHGQRPTGSIKQRRAGSVNDPAGEFQAHLGSCSRCQKADTPEMFCPRWAAYVTQDTKALREQLRS